MTSWCPDMFEDSPKRNTKRLFLWASDEIAGSLRRRYRLEEYLAPDYAYMAWLIGSASAAQALIRQVDVVTAAWGQGDEEKTLSLIKLGVSHLLSVWLGGVDRRPGLTGEARRVEYERAGSSGSWIAWLKAPGP